MELIGENRDTDRRIGSAIYAGDLTFAGMLHAAFVTSPHPHATIRAIDTAAALATPGVHAVLTGNDIGPVRFGVASRDYPLLAIDRVLFVGQRVAAVAADDLASARRAAALVEVTYEPLPTIYDPLSAAASGAPVLHPDHLGNVQGVHEEGDRTEVLDQLAACDEVFDHTFSWGRTHSAPLETHVCVVAAGPAGVDVHSANKMPYRLRRDLAEFAGIDEDDVRIHPIRIGGDFGAKGSSLIEGVAYFLSVATGRPVRIALSYAEMLTSTHARHPGSVRLRTGIRDDRLHVHAADGVLDGGAFAAFKGSASRLPRFIGVPMHLYEVGHRHERSTGYYTNNLPAGPVRAPGHFQASFAGESHIDMIARAIGADPLEFRIAHARSDRARRVLEELRTRMAAWGGKLTTGRGIGVAAFYREAGHGRSTVRCSVTPAAVTVEVGVPDQGGGTYRAMCTLVSMLLEVSPDMVRVKYRGAVPDLVDSGSAGSKVTVTVGAACADACHQVLERLGPPDVVDDRYWIGPRLAALQESSLDVIGDSDAPGSGAGDREPGVGALGVEVAVDLDTGHVAVQRATVVVDAGLVLNARGYLGQLEGGFVYGLGQTLVEHMEVIAGRVLTDSLRTYTLPNASATPPLQIVLLEGDARPDASAGVIRPVGELVNVGVPGAVVNAVHDAVGVRVTELPVRPECVWRGLHTS